MTNGLTRLYSEKTTAGYFNTARTEIFPFLPKAPFTVFEVGCGEGATLSWLKHAGLAKWAGGVDISETAISKAKMSALLDFVAVANVESGPSSEIVPTTDVLLILDVLEHLSDPWATLSNLVGTLRNGACVIVSVPNVRSIRVLVPLLFLGHWTYRDSGILDKTHLRFFTRRTAIQLVESAGLRVEAISTLKDFHWLLNLANWMSIGLFKDFLTPQFLIKATR